MFPNFEDSFDFYRSAIVPVISLAGLRRRPLRGTELIDPTAAALTTTACPESAAESGPATN